jgi:hypothetical protein
VLTDQVLTVALDPQAAALSRRHQTVLASLPARFRVTADPAAQVLLVSGDQPGWQARADHAIASGVSAIMLSGSAAMTAADVTGLATAAAGASVLAAVDLAYAAARSWTDALPALAGDVPDSAVLDSLVTAPPPGPGQPGLVALRSALIEQLALARPLIGEPGALSPVHVGAHEYLLAGSPGDLAVTLAGSLSAATGHSLDLALVGAKRRWHVRFAADALAAPVTITAYDGDGERAWPLVYESGHRAGWLRLHGAVCRGEPLLHSAAHLAADLATAQAALGQVLA